MIYLSKDFQKFKILKNEKKANFKRMKKKIKREREREQLLHWKEKEKKLRTGKWNQRQA